MEISEYLRDKRKRTVSQESISNSFTNQSQNHQPLLPTFIDMTNNNNGSKNSKKFKSEHDFSSSNNNFLFYANNNVHLNIINNNNGNNSSSNNNNDINQSIQTNNVNTNDLATSTIATLTTIQLTTTTLMINNNNNNNNHNHNNNNNNNNNGNNNNTNINHPNHPNHHQNHQHNNNNFLTQHNSLLSTDLDDLFPELMAGDHSNNNHENIDSTSPTISPQDITSLITSPTEVQLERLQSYPPGHKGWFPINKLNLQQQQSQEEKEEEGEEANVATTNTPPTESEPTTPLSSEENIQAYKTGGARRRGKQLNPDVEEEKNKSDKKREDFKDYEKIMAKRVGEDDIDIYDVFMLFTQRYDTWKATKSAFYPGKKKNKWF